MTSIVIQACYSAGTTKVWIIDVQYARILDKLGLGNDLSKYLYGLTVYEFKTTSPLLVRY